ncbi:hypothetical protein YN1551_2132 [Sulfolobus islandicus Y.N.15.51]|uniref:Cytochrome oxidase subunit II copper A binding domain-containing protein n=1 Tax=Saccharolobus islandicus (strain Y.N.15.51 / Yellowstone \|nr:hypothetical protein [Sulfolobus islandicus]ACP49150.1 hypothetical protein YN1551_2132 [Sulfolobus islandicus Y.N.15.51]
MSGKQLIVTLLFLALGVVIGFGSSLLFLPRNTTSVSTTQGQQVIYIAVIPDYGGNGWDAFVPLKYLGYPITAHENIVGINNTIVVKAGVPVKFVIINLDTMVTMNFSGNVAVPFILYNDTENGQITLTFNKGQYIQNLPIGHTFTIPKLDINIPLPPDTVVSFNYTFTNPGTYEYLCITPCGPGMGQLGYMVGYIIVQL